MIRILFFIFFVARLYAECEDNITEATCASPCLWNTNEDGETSCTTADEIEAPEVDAEGEDPADAVEDAADQAEDEEVEGAEGEEAPEAEDAEDATEDAADAAEDEEVEGAEGEEAPEGEEEEEAADAEDAAEGEESLQPLRKARETVNGIDCDLNEANCQQCGGTWDVETEVDETEYDCKGVTQEETPEIETEEAETEEAETEEAETEEAETVEVDTETEEAEGVEETAETDAEDTAEEAASNAEDAADTEDVAEDAAENAADPEEIEAPEIDEETGLAEDAGEVDLTPLRKAHQADCDTGESACLACGGTWVAEAADADETEIEAVEGECTLPEEAAETEVEEAETEVEEAETETEVEEAETDCDSSESNCQACGGTWTSEVPDADETETEAVEGECSLPGDAEVEEAETEEAEVEEAETDCDASETNCQTCGGTWQAEAQDTGDVEVEGECLNVPETDADAPEADEEAPEAPEQPSRNLRSPIGYKQNQHPNYILLACTFLISVVFSAWCVTKVIDGYSTRNTAIDLDTLTSDAYNYDTLV